MAIVVNVAREEEEDDIIGPVVAPYFPGKKTEEWWLVVGDSSKNRLMANKRFPLKHNHKARLEFTTPEAGDHTLTLSFMCDSYMGCDQEYEFDIKVLEGQSSDEEEDSEEEGMGEE